jgi:hypothetical protein
MHVPGVGTWFVGLVPSMSQGLYMLSRSFKFLKVMNDIFMEAKKIWQNVHFDIRPTKKENMCVYCHPTDPIFYPDPKTFYWKFFLKIYNILEILSFYETEWDNLISVFKTVNKYKNITDNNP